jgi:hypothetical protein
MYKASIQYDFECSDCSDVFFEYEFQYELDYGQVLSDDGIAYTSITCPSCGGGDREVLVPVPVSWDNQITEEKE